MVLLRSVLAKYTSCKHIIPVLGTLSQYAQQHLEGNVSESEAFSCPRGMCEQAELPGTT